MELLSFAAGDCTLDNLSHRRQNRPYFSAILYIVWGFENPIDPTISAGLLDVHFILPVIIVLLLASAILIAFKIHTKAQIHSITHDLIEQRGFVKSILETANSLVVCLDSRARIIVFNGECERVTGYTREEVLGKSWIEVFLPEEHRHDGLKNFAEWVRQHPSDKNEGAIINKSGERKTILWSNSAIFYPESDQLIAIAIGHDISESRLAQEAIKKSEEKYRNLVENSTDIIFTVDFEGNFLFVNKAFERTLGYSIEEARKINGFSLVHPDDQQNLRKSFAPLLAGENVQGLEYRYKTKWGNYLNILTNASPIIGRQGRTSALLGIAHDMTEHVRARNLSDIQRELGYRLCECDNMNDALRLTLDISLGIDGIDGGGVYLYDGFTGFMDMVYYRELTEEFARAISHFLPDSPEVDFARKRSAMYGPLPKPWPYPAKLTDSGTPRSIAVIPIFFDRQLLGTLNLYSLEYDDLPLMIREALETISNRIGNSISRIRIGDALRESEKTYRTLVENTSESILIVNQDGQCTFINRFGAAQLGVSPEDIVGKTVWDIFEREEADRNLKYLQEAIASGKGRIGRIDSLICGQKKWYQFNIQPLGCNGSGSQSAMIVAMDITDIESQRLLLQQQEVDIKKLSRRLIEVQENDRKSIARELHDSVAQKLCLAKIKLEGALPDISPDARPRLKEISSLISEITSDLREISSALRPRILDESGLIPALKWYLKHHYHGLGYSLDVIGEEQPLTVEKQTNIFRICQEIFLNVHKHSGASNMKVRIEFAPNDFILSISDNGKGFDHDKIKNDWRQKQSCGLLNINERAKLMGGRLEIISEKGKGASFTITVPNEWGDYGENSNIHC